MADKLHNARSILEDHQQVGDEIWSRFNEKRPEGQLWYYATLVDIFDDRIPDQPQPRAGRRRRRAGGSGASRPPGSAADRSMVPPGPRLTPRLVVR